MYQRSILPVWLQKLTLVIGHLLCLIGLLMMLLNSGWSVIVFDHTLNQKFSGSLVWNRLAWGPYPWQLKLQGISFFDAKKQLVMDIDSILVDNYSLLDLLEKRIVLSGITIQKVVLYLQQREHTYDADLLIFNIAEMFADAGIDIDDGEYPALSDIYINDIEIKDFDLHLKMPRIHLDAYQLQMQKGFFAFDLASKKMNIHAQNVTTRQLDTHIYLRKEEQYNEVELLKAPIEKDLFYSLKSVKVSDFWWLADQFSARDLTALSFDQDPIQIQTWIMDLIPNSIPHFRALVKLNAKEISAYTKPWLGKSIQGEVKVKANLHGPVDLLAADNLSTEGQLFIDNIGGIRFQIDGSKSRDEELKIRYGRSWSALGDLEISGSYDLIHQLGTMKVHLNDLTWPKLYSLPSAWKGWEHSLQGYMDFKLRPNEHYTWEMSIESLLFMKGVHNLELKGLASLQGSTLQAHFLDLRINDRKGQNLTSYGSYNWKKKTINAHLKTNLSLYPKMLPPLHVPLLGKLQIDLTMKRRNTDLPIYIQGKASLTQGKLLYQKLNWKLPKAKLAFTLNKNQISISDLYIRKDQGSMRGDFKIPLHKPIQTKGWLILDHLDIDLQPLNIPFRTTLNGLTCSAGIQGCQKFIRKYPLHASQKDNTCLVHLYQDSTHAQGIEMCMSLLQPTYQKLHFKELAINARWLKDQVLIKRARLWKSRRLLLLDGEGRFNPQKQSIQLQADLLNFPLQLLHLFTPKAPFELKTLFGTVKGKILLEGTRKKFDGHADFTLQNMSFKTRADNPLTLQMRTAKLDFIFNQHAATAKGHLGKQIWFDAYIPFNSKEKGFLGADLNQLAIHYLHGLSQGQVGYQREEKKLLATHDTYGIDPISFSNPNQALDLIGFNDQFACTARHLDLANTHLWSIYVQGRVSMEWQMNQEKFLPWVDLYVDTLTTEYWGRDTQKARIKLNRQATPLYRCPQDKALKTIPSLSLKITDTVYFAFQSLYSIVDTLWINPSFTKLKTTQLKTTQLKTTQRPTPTKIKIQAVHKVDATMGSSLTHLAREQVRGIPKNQSLSSKVTLICDNTQSIVSQDLSRNLKVNFTPILIKDQQQSIQLQGMLYANQAYLCLRSSLKLQSLNYYLNRLYQKSRGKLKLQIAVQGHVQNPSLSGQLFVNNMSLIAPRSRMMGDLILVKPLTLEIKPESKGGFSILLPQNTEVHLRRNSNDIFISALKVNLTQFVLQSLSLNFFANQMEFKLVDIGRLTTQLNQMSFMMTHIKASDQEQLSFNQNDLNYDLLLAGNVDILRGRYTANFLGSNDLINQGFRNNISGRSNVETLSIFESAPILKRLKLDLNIQGEDDLFIRNQVGAILNLDLEVKTDLQAKGYLYSFIQDQQEDQFKLLGEINTLDGSSITYANNSFEVINGQVRFGDLFSKGQSASFLNAHLEATHTFRIPVQNKNRQNQISQNNTNELIDEEVTLRASIEMSTKKSHPQIKLDLQSASGASRLEVASLLVTGRYSSDLSASQSTQPATELLLSPLMDLIERPLEDSLGLSLNLTPDNTGSLFVNINQVFSRRWRLYAHTAIGDSESDVPQTFGLEYRLNNILLGELTRENVNQLNNTNFRLHLRWSWD